MNPVEIEAQFIAAYDAYADAIFRYCFYRTYNRERAKDLMQEAFTRSWEYIASGKEVKNIRAFLYRVANNLIIDESRKKKMLSLDELHEQGFEPSYEERGRLELLADAKHAKELLSALDEKQRDVILMRYVDDLTPKEIAEILGESENIVSVRLHRALKKVKTLIPENV